MKRRSFFFLSALGSLILLTVNSILATVRFLVPRITYEPPSKFPVGKVSDFPPNSVTFLSEKRLFIFHSDDGLYAISSVCTHLGCNVRWFAESSEFRCPCHGSVFSSLGEVKSGPAPKPLRWCALSLSRKGEVVVDLNEAVSPDFRLVVA